VRDDEQPGAVERKILPRNLTARAAHEPAGNPPSTRPESGPDNCFPGLDIDQRNLDSAFFPGLHVDFHLVGDGAIVTAIADKGPAADAGLTEQDLPLFLWGLIGRTETGQALSDAPGFSLAAISGMDVWARAHDLMPGRVAVLLGPDPARLPTIRNEDLEEMQKAFDSGVGVVRRQADKKVRLAALVGERARYLDANGVIDPLVYEPGQLTVTLCAPWQYDFRDCACNYWAASRPDIVTSADGKQEHAYFLRRNHQSTPPPDVATGDRPDGMGHADLVGGAWNSVLPVVLDDREVQSATYRRASPTVRRIMGKQEVVRELRYLATVEHALCVQYLFAHYSLKAPAVLPLKGVTDEMRRIFAAAREIFAIAIDEMRHLRWVNEALILLGEEAPELGRAEKIGHRLRRRFRLRRLTRKQLDWFIKVEEPSREVQEGVDGMYVQLLASIQSSDMAERVPLAQLIKLIIDEGDDHYERFLSVKAQLEGLSEDEYLRFKREGGKQARPHKTVEELLSDSDRHYHYLLSSLTFALVRGDRAGGTFMEQSRRAMRSLHETNHMLAEAGVPPPFTLPDEWKRPWEGDEPPLDDDDQDLGQ
jgi:hypothetical protein